MGISLSNADERHRLYHDDLQCGAGGMRLVCVLFLNDEPLQWLWDRGEIGPEDLAHGLFVFSWIDTTWMDRISLAIYDALLDAEGAGCRLSLPLGVGRDNLVVRLNRMLSYAGYREVRGSDAELAQLGADVERLAREVQELNASLGLMVIVY